MDRNYQCKKPQTPVFVIPVKTGIQFFELFGHSLDSGLRGNDEFLRSSKLGSGLSGLGFKKKFMVSVAQLVRAPGCGPGGRGFESLHSPHFS
jgi:hypothetical protein